MYGLVNKAVEDLLTREHGPEVWKKVCERAGVSEIGFISMEPYDDDITYRLVGAAADLLETPAEDLLRAFGRFWTLYTAAEGYGELLDMTGDTFAEFLSNLDNMHARVGFNFEQLRPPSFRCETVDDNHLRLHYYSEREGLTPMVEGLIQGLADRFKVKSEITHLPKNGSCDHDVFEIAIQR